MGAREWIQSVKLPFLVSLATICVLTDGQAPSPVPFPYQFRGDWYSLDQGKELSTLISEQQMRNEKLADSECVGVQIINGTVDAQGDFDGRILVHDKVNHCYQCFEMYHRTVNIMQYKQTTCVTGNEITLESVCSAINVTSDMVTMFRMTLRTVNCKTTWEGTFHFTYETTDSGEGGMCNSSENAIVACQAPGSVYVDNQVFNMHFGKCADVADSFNQSIRFQCMGTWTDANGNIYSWLTDIGSDQYRNRFRCMLTRNDQKHADGSRYYALSRGADCSSLKSPYDEPLRLRTWPAYIGSLGASTYGTQLLSPSCNFPQDFAGTWFTTTELEFDVIINATHIHFKTKQDAYVFRESVFVCQQNNDSQYLVTAVTVGSCEIDYVCFDFMPRLHNIIQWKMSRPYRLSSWDMSFPGYLERTFQKTCDWSMFTLDQNDTNPSWKTFILNPPNPVPCPIGGRYNFTQTGSPEEKYMTYVADRPRNIIDCRQNVSEFRSCDDNPKKILISTQYCATLDATGKPIGEYEIAYRELSCVGYWLEDNKSYMVTYDMDDAASAFRCWVYKRSDRPGDLHLSRASRAACDPRQTAYSSAPSEGASLAVVLKASEPPQASCRQRYNDGSSSYFDDASSLSSHALVMMPLLLFTVKLAWPAL